MRYVLFSLVVLVSFACRAQEPLSFSGVVAVDSASKEDLYVRARAWINEAFKSSKDVIQISDKETGELSCKGNATLTATYHMLGKRTYDIVTRFSMNIWVKDGRYKYEIKDFNTENPLNKADVGVLTTDSECPKKWAGTPKKTMNEVWASTKVDAEVTAKRMIEDLEKAMKTKTNTDW